MNYKEQLEAIEKAHESAGMKLKEQLQLNFDRIEALDALVRSDPENFDYARQWNQTVSDCVDTFVKCGELMLKAKLDLDAYKQFGKPLMGETDGTV